MELQGKTVLITGGTAGMGLEAAKQFKALISGLKKNQFIIRVGDTKAIYIINRIFPRLTFGLVNSKKSDKLLLPNK